MTDKQTSNETNANIDTEAQDKERDLLAAQMAKELGSVEDFDPTDAVAAMPADDAKAALEETGELLQQDKAFAEDAVTTALDMVEDVLQDHGHKDFLIADKQKARGISRLTPVIQKYAPQVLGSLGEYKDEVLAGVWMASFSFGSVKQIKALKLEDAKRNKRNESIDNESVDNEPVNDPNEAVEA